MEAEQEREKTKRFFGTRPKKNPAQAGWLKCLGLVRATPWADFDVIRVYSCSTPFNYSCSTPFNYHSNLSMCGTSLQNLIHLPDNCRLLATPKEICNLNLSAVTLSMWSFRTPISIFCTKELYNPVFFWAQPPSPLYGDVHIYTNIYIHVHACVCYYTNIYIHVHACVCYYTNIYIHVHVCVCICV